MLDSDLNLGSIGAGLATMKPRRHSSFDGSYGLDFTQSTSGLELDGTGQITVNGSASTSLASSLGFVPNLESVSALGTNRATLQSLHRGRTV